MNIVRKLHTGCLRWSILGLFLLLHVAFFPSGIAAGEEEAAAGETTTGGIPVEIPQWRFSLRLPSEKWQALEVQEMGEGPNRRAAYGYKRAPIRDSEGRPIEPVIGFVFREVPEGAEPILWIGMVQNGAAEASEVRASRLLTSLAEIAHTTYQQRRIWRATSENRARSNDMSYI